MVITIVHLPAKACSIGIVFQHTLISEGIIGPKLCTKILTLRILNSSPNIDLVHTCSIVDESNLYILKCSGGLAVTAFTVTLLTLHTLLTRLTAGEDYSTLIHLEKQ
jgi:hypothetical protein